MSNALNFIFTLLELRRTLVGNESSYVMYRKWKAVNAVTETGGKKIIRATVIPVFDA